MRLQARKIEDGRGPYRWRPVIDTASGLAVGGQYDVAQELSAERAEQAKRSLAVSEYEWREL